MQNKLFIISNESIFNSKNSYFCDNLDMKTTPEGLKDKFDINIIARSSKKERSHKINSEKIKSAKIKSSSKQQRAVSRQHNSQQLAVSIQQSAVCS